LAASSRASRTLIAAISGQTTPQMLIRFRADVIALQPKVVVILAGTNDIAGNTGPMTLAAIEDNLISMFEPSRTATVFAWCFLPCFQSATTRRPKMGNRSLGPGSDRPTRYWL